MSSTLSSRTGHALLRSTEQKLSELSREADQGKCFCRALVRTPLIALIRQCDRFEPVCSQCKRAGKACGGYRDVPSFAFRDENDKAARRSAMAKSRSEARRKRVKDSTPDPDGSPVSSCPSRLSSVVQRRSSPMFLGQTIPAAVSSSLEEQGLRFFFNRFVTAISAVENSPYDIKSPPFLGAISLEARLRDAVISVGLAAMANVTRDRTLLLVSREKYVAAINSVRLAVGNPEQVSPDQTFKLIVMLSLYEVRSDYRHLYPRFVNGRLNQTVVPDGLLCAKPGRLLDSTL